MKADPTAQLKLPRRRQSSTPGPTSCATSAAHLPELAEIAPWTAERTDLDDQARDARIVVDDLTVEQKKVDADVEQVKTRREPRPRPDGPGPDHQPQGPRADAARAGVAGAADHHAGGRGARGDGGGWRRPSRSSTPSASRRRGHDERLAELVTARDEKQSAIDAELAGVDERAGACCRTECRRTCWRSTTGSVSRRAASARPRCAPASAAAAGMSLDNAEISRHPLGPSRRGDPVRGVPADPGPHRRVGTLRAARPCASTRR